MFTTNAKSTANASSPAVQEPVRTESASVVDLPVDASLNETNKYKNVIYL